MLHHADLALPCLFACLLACSPSCRFVPVSKGRRQLTPSAAPSNSFNSSATSSIPRQQQHQHHSPRSHRQQSSASAAQQSNTYDPALAAARARAGLMNPGGQGPRGGGSNRSSASRVRGGNNLYAGYEPGYEMEVHSSTYYRQRPGGVGSSSTSSLAQALRGSGPSGWDGASSGGDGMGCNRSGNASRPWLKPGGSSSRDVGMWRRSSSSGVTPGGSLGAAYGGSQLGPVHSAFSIATGGGDGYGSGGGSSRAGAGGGVPLPAEAPLDDLLLHVNHLISEFDRMYAD